MLPPTVISVRLPHSQVALCIALIRPLLALSEVYPVNRPSDGRINHLSSKRTRLDRSEDVAQSTAPDDVSPQNQPDEDDEQCKARLGTTMDSTTIGKMSRAIAIRVASIELADLRRPLIARWINLCKFGPHAEKTDCRRDERNYARHR